MNLQQLLSEALTPQTINAIASQLGADPQQVQQGIGAALPALVGGLAHNATSGGAPSLASALEQDHDGALFDQLRSSGGGGGDMVSSLLGGLLGGGGGGGLGSSSAGGGLMGALGGLLGGRATNGAGILGHVLGGRQNDVQSGVSQVSGLGRGQSLQLLMMLAPMVMSALGKLKRQRGLDEGGVAQVLDDEEDRMTQPVPGMERGSLKDLFKGEHGELAGNIAKMGAVLGGAYLLSKTARPGSV